MKRTLMILSTLGLSSALVLACGDKDDDTGDGGGDTGHEHGDDTGETSDVDGAAVFASTCADCHGADGTSGTAPDLSERVPTKTDEELETLITEGQNYMPAQELESDEVGAVITYLRETFPG